MKTFLMSRILTNATYPKSVNTIEYFASVIACQPAHNDHKDIKIIYMYEAMIHFNHPMGKWVLPNLANLLRLNLSRLAITSSSKVFV